LYLYYTFSNTFNEHETPEGNSVFNNKSSIAGDSVLMSISRLYNLTSKCSRDFLST
jgi:hypothetical protein